MTILDVVEKLPERQRATLALHMLHSLPARFADSDDGLGEALRRDAELEANPSVGVALEEFDAKISQRRSV